MTDVLLRMLCCVTVGLAVVLLLRRPARRAFGAGPAFTLWLLPAVLALAPVLPQRLVPAAVLVLPGITVTPSAAMSATSSMAGGDWAHGLVALWLSVAALGLLRLALYCFGLLRDMRPVPAAWTHMLTDAAPDLDARRVRTHAAGPAVLWALPRALILLPADFVQRFDNAAMRELVLRHELAHVRRGDAWWSLAMEIASALLWFHPLAWIARPRFRLDQELACDAASLRALPSRAGSYARALIDSVAAQPMPALIPWLAEPQLKERIAMIIRIPPGALRRRAGFLAIAALLTGGLFVAAAQTPLRAATQGTSASTPLSVDASFQSAHEPLYPADAVHKGEQGTVMLDVAIDATGKVVDVRIDQHGTNASAALQVAAVRAAGKWRFNPGRKNGRAVGGIVQVPVNFSLDAHKDAGVSKPCPAGDVYDDASSRCVKPQAATSA